MTDTDLLVYLFLFYVLLFPLAQAIGRNLGKKARR
jgi:hypothetical protein